MRRASSAWLGLGLSMMASSACEGPSPGGILAPDEDAATCGPPVPNGEPCNTLAPIAAPVVPTCASGAVPMGTGGIIVPGTYVLTQQTFYNIQGCSTEPIAETFAFVGGGCVENVVQVGFGADAGPTTYHFLFTVTQPQGNELSLEMLCVSPPSGGTSDGPRRTYTATPTTLTWTVLDMLYSTAEPDHVDVFTKQ
jgi:hypothetical protein